MIGRFSRNDKRNIIIITILCGWFCCGLIIPFPNHGGSGLSLPQNILTWAIMGIIVLCSSIYRLNKKDQTYFVLTAQATNDDNHGTRLILIGVVLWTLPLFWSPHIYLFINALPRIIAVWGAIGFYLYLLVTISCSQIRQSWLTILTISTIIQAMYSLWQIFTINNLSGGRPYGIFQQVNVLASFLSTGIACTLWLYLNNKQNIYQIISRIGLILIPFILVILQSRAGYIGSSLSILMLLLSTSSNKTRAVLKPLTFITIGISLGILWKYLGSTIFPNLIFPIVDKTSSDQSRLYMLKLTWKMIMNHPFIGNGYGSFESEFGNLAQKIPPGLEGTTVIYPHNEVLYSWVEGGLTALCGIILIIIGILKRLYSKGALGITGVALLIPLAVHMNLEYPLYQSANHLLILIMLVLVSGPAPLKYDSTIKCPRQFSIPNRLLHINAGIISLMVIIFMSTCFLTQYRLTRIEQYGLSPFVKDEPKALSSLPNKLSQKERIEFDRHVSMLLKYNITHDVSLLTEFNLWARRYLLVHNDPSVYSSLLAIAYAQKLPHADQICRNARGRWPQDQRFDCKQSDVY